MENNANLGDITALVDGCLTLHKIYWDSAGYYQGGNCLIGEPKPPKP